MGSWVQGEEADNCGNDDGAFNEASFVIATEPAAGERVESGFEAKGCSRTFESDVQWKLIGRDGLVLASGNTNGGGVDGPGAFSFTVPYTVDARQIAHLEVFEEDVSDGEGFPGAHDRAARIETLMRNSRRRHDEAGSRHSERRQGGRRSARDPDR
jgi:hypothetical protein